MFLKANFFAKPITTLLNLAFQSLAPINVILTLEFCRVYCYPSLKKRRKEGEDDKEALCSFHYHLQEPEDGADGGGSLPGDRLPPGDIRGDGLFSKGCYGCG